jgi:hypothetical protein
MSSLAQLQSEREALSARLSDLNSQLSRLSSAPASATSVRLTTADQQALADESFRLAQERDAVRRQRDAVDKQIDAIAPNVPARAEFLGSDDRTGAFFYRNRQTGDRFFSQAPPTAAQQAAFNAANAPAPEPQPAQSASQQVETQTSQAPQPLPAAQVTPVGDTGTDAPVKTVEESQSITTASNSGQATPAPDNSFVFDENGELVPGDSAQAAEIRVQQGQGAKDDARDTAPPTAAVNATETVEPNIKPRPNILDEFASYTYSASVYLLSTEQYVQLLTTDSKEVNGYNLLFQTAGAANNRGGPQEPTSTANGSNTADAGRNPFFDNDFYIDSITVETVPMGKATGAAHNTQNLKFTLVEPNGITLLDRLYDAVANFYPRSADGRVNYTAVSYLMVIRFYGYDSMGRPVQVKNRQFDTDGTAGTQAVVEKFIPFRVNNITWGVSSRMVTYEWDCTPEGHQIAGYTARGTVPYDIQLSETTVGGLLSGPAKFSNQSAPAANPGASTTSAARNSRDAQRQAIERQNNQTAPAKVNAAPSDKKVLTQGLADALNQFQQELVQRGRYTYADEYEIEFVGPGSEKIRDAVLASAGENPIAQTASGRASTQDPNGLRPSTNSIDRTTKNFSIVAGQQIVQVIDLLIRNSSYIYDQALVIIDKDGSVKPNPNSRNQPMKWYNISLQAERLSEELDPQRNDYAYRIKYVISPFIVKNLESKYFITPKFSGVHKSYPYWFTGQNSAVLDYTETLNALYHLTISGEVPGDSDAIRIRERETSSLAELIKYTYAPRSSESSAGNQGKTNELAANAAESLYSPSDIAHATIKIVGDPDWIQQGTIFRAADERSLGARAFNTGFLPDGSVSFDTQDILFEIVWKRPNDYDIRTGKADPYARSASKYNNYSAEQSRVYHCKKVISEFRQGRFEQTLEGTLYSMAKPDQTNTANPSAAASANLGQLDAGRPIAPRIPTRDAAAALSRAEFAQVDPRRLDIGDGGAAAIQGAVASSRLIKPNPVNVGANKGSSPVEISRAIEQTTAPPPLTLFSQPRPPTSGTGTSVQSVVFQSPRSLPSADPSVGRLTNAQVQDLVNQQSSTVNTNPTSVNNPANQRRVIDP